MISKKRPVVGIFGICTSIRSAYPEPTGKVENCVDLYASNFSLFNISRSRCRPSWKDKVDRSLNVLNPLPVNGNAHSRGHAAEQAAVGVVPPMVAGVFLGITGVLLIADLKQPTRFHYLLTRGNTDSWLVKGAYVLMFFAAMCGLWWIGGLTENDGLIEIVAVPAALGALGTAGYTAYLFAQCEGRDLWQTPLLLPVLLAQAVTAGGATYAVLDVFMDLPEQNAIAWVLLGGVVATGAFVWMELASHGSRHVELAVETMTHGRYARQFWVGGITVGLVVPGAIAILALATDISSPAPLAAAGIAAVAGLFAYEDAFVRAGQSVPLS